MARPREGNYKIISVNLDPEETDKFVKTLKHSQSLSEVFRQFIRDENQRIESEKNLNAPDNGALRLSKTKHNIYYNKNKNLALDLFMIERREIITILDQVDIKPLIGRVIGNAKVVLNYGQKRLNAL